MTNKKTTDDDVVVEVASWSCTSRQNKNRKTFTEIRFVRVLYADALPQTSIATKLWGWSTRRMCLVTRFGSKLFSIQNILQCIVWPNISSSSNMSLSPSSSSSSFFFLRLSTTSREELISSSDLFILNGLLNHVRSQAKLSTFIVVVAVAAAAAIVSQFLLSESKLSSQWLALVSGCAILWGRLTVCEV